MTHSDIVPTSCAGDLNPHTNAAPCVSGVRGHRVSSRCGATFAKARVQHSAATGGDLCRAKRKKVSPAATPELSLPESTAATTAAPADARPGLTRRLASFLGISRARRKLPAAAAMPADRTASADAAVSADGGADDLMQQESADDAADLQRAPSLGGNSGPRDSLHPSTVRGREPAPAGSDNGRRLHRAGSWQEPRIALAPLTLPTNASV